jgi:hypothetical protein
MENSITLAQDNKITLSRYSFTPIEKRCLYYIIKEVRRLYVDRDLREDDKPYQNLFSDMYLRLKPEQLQQLGDEVKDVYSALRKLREREILIDTEDVWVTTSWILKAKHDKKSRTYEVQVSNDILPYLVELASQFTEYSLTIAISLRSTYSQRFYEMCCMYRNKGKFFLEIDKLRYMLKIEDKKAYDNTAELKRSILDVAQKELKELFDAGQCDLYFTYRTKDTQGRKILSYWFDIHTKESMSEIDYQEIEAQIRRIIEIVKAFVKNDPDYYKRIQTALQLSPNVVGEVLAKLNKRVNDYSRKDMPGVIRHILQEDYGIKSKKTL